MSVDKLVMQQDKVLVRRDEANKKIGKIHLPETAEKKTQRGTVLGIGPGDWEHGHFLATSVKVGAKVWFALYAGHELEIDGEKFLAMQERDILAVEKE
jgi:chaperonin GroES